MARNVALQLLRGVEANIPSLSVGELYFATDTFNLWVGTANGTAVQIGANPLYFDYAALAAQDNFNTGNAGFVVVGG